MLDLQMADSVRDLRFTFRLLAKNPGFATAAVLALALGIGPNTAIFSVLYGSVLAPLPYTDPDRLVAIWSKVNGERNQVSAADFLDWKRMGSSFQQMAALSNNRQSSRPTRSRNTSTDRGSPRTGTSSLVKKFGWAVTFAPKRISPERTTSSSCRIAVGRVDLEPIQTSSASNFSSTANRIRLLE